MFYRACIVLLRVASQGRLNSFFKLAERMLTARDPDGRTALLHAVNGDNTSCVEALVVAAGADPSISDNAQIFPLYLAVQSENTAIVKALIEADANINAIVERPDSGTALSVAASMGNKIMVRLLLDAGCDTSIIATGGHHPLTKASLQGHSEIVTLLLDAGANVSAMASDGVTALIGGVYIGSCDVVKRLLEGGANVNQPNPIRSALHVAAQEGFEEVINILTVAGADVDQTEEERARTPLHVSAFRGDPKCVWALLRAGANVSAKDYEGSSPLHIAAYKGFTEVIEVLLSGGGHADVNREDNEHRTPLSLASDFADVRAVNLMLDAEAEINRLDAQGRTALFHVEELKIVKALVERGADAKVVDKHGVTVLHTAGHRGTCAGVICALYKAGADPTVKGKQGETAADIARGQGHDDAAKLLDLLAAKHRSMNST